MSTVSIKHVLQIGIIVSDVKAALENFCRLFSLDEKKAILIPDTGEGITSARYYGQEVSFRLAIALINYAGIQFEFIQPLGGDANPYSDFLQQHGPGIHHINVQYSDYDHAIHAFEAAGGKEMVSGQLFGGHFCYWDLCNSIGLVLESSKDLTDEYAQSILHSS